MVIYVIILLLDMELILMCENVRAIGTHEYEYLCSLDMKARGSTC